MNIISSVSHTRRRLSRRFHCVLPLVAGMIISACALQTPAGSVPTTVPTPTFISAYAATSAAVESYSSMIDTQMRSSVFSPIYGGVLVENQHIVVLVTELRPAIQALLVSKGIPNSAFEVRKTATQADLLHQAEAAAMHWIGQFPGGGGVGIHASTNELIISVERQPLVTLIGYDPKDEPVPYEKWPPSLQKELASVLPQVNVKLYGGFASTQQTGNIP